MGEAFSSPTAAKSRDVCVPREIPVFSPFHTHSPENRPLPSSRGQCLTLSMPLWPLLLPLSLPLSS